MTWWRPGRDWFRTEAPKLLAIGEKVEAMPAIAPIAARQT